MAIKAHLESLDGLAEALKAEYKPIEVNGKKSFILDVEGAFLTDEPVDALKRAKDYEKNERKQATDRAAKLAADLEAATSELESLRKGALPKGDVEKLEASWKKKFDDLSKEKDGAVNKMGSTLKKVLVENVAQSIASKISIAPDLMLPQVVARLKVEETESGYLTRVLDREGQPSALTLEELQKELAADKRFAPIIMGSKASGGSASGNSGGSGGTGSQAVDGKFDFTKSSYSACVDQIRARKQARAKE